MMKSSLQEELRQNSSSSSGRTRTTTKQNNNNGDCEEDQLGSLKCPRCDSTNTKFCYYNNYSLTQPRHFCKTCRRYWTKGGALRNVPIGGGCRKTKKLKSSSSNNSSSSSSSLAFKFFSQPSVDFGAIGEPSSSPSLLFPRSCLSLDQPSNNLNLPSSIESLSSLNQDLHWKLQQQRLAMIFEDQPQNKDQNQNFFQPILFHNHHQPPKQDSSSSFNIKESIPLPPPPTTTDQWLFPNNTSSRLLGDDHGSGWNNNNNDHGVQAWEDLHHFTAFP